VAVQPDGSVVLPLIGSVAAGGATTGELERQISTRLAKGLIRDAHVSVTVQQYRSKLVFVVGEVSRPGAYPLAGETRIVEILARAGPLTKDASSDILVVRPAEPVQRPVLPAQVKAREEQRAGGHGLPAGQVRATCGRSRPAASTRTSSSSPTTPCSFPSRSRSSSPVK
jgi:protein involved in polysaccharide export with SLBB domain